MLIKLPHGPTLYINIGGNSTYMNYRLYISYRDICFHEKIVVEHSNALELYNDMKLTHVYESHWNTTHSDLGDFQYSTDSPHFPTVEEFDQILNSLSIGQIKYVMRSKRYNCSYYCGLKRIS